MKRSSAVLGGLLLAGAIFAADQSAKRYTEKQKGVFPEGKLYRKNPVFLLQKSHNPGAFLRLGNRKPSLIAAISVFMTVLTGLMLLFSFGNAGNGLLRTGLSALFGGAFSNTYDRLQKKYVVDYISFKFGPEAFRRIVFNLADFAILAGSVLILLGTD